MCWPTFRGFAYLASSVFIYRGILVVITMISTLVTGLKMTYLPITIIEESLLQLIYFIPLFTMSSFAFLGVESDSYSFVLYPTVALFATLFIRYAAEFSYIYLVNWDSFRLKTPSLILNLTTDFILILVLLFYVYSRLRNHQKLQDEMLLLIHEQEMPVAKNSMVVTRGYSNPQNPGSPKIGDRAGVGQGVGAGVALHYPTAFAVDKDRLDRPLPPTPLPSKSKSPSMDSDDYEDLPLGPPPKPPLPAPLASPDYDEV